MSDILPFEIQALAYDPNPGRARLEKDLRTLVRRAQDRVTDGDHTGGQALARVALQYYRALHPTKRNPGPS